MPLYVLDYNTYLRMCVVRAIFLSEAAGNRCMHTPKFERKVPLFQTENRLCTVLQHYLLDSDTYIHLL